MMNCFDATRLLSEALERPLTLKELMSLNMHTLRCAACRNFGKQMHFLRLAAKTYAKRASD